MLNLFARTLRNNATPAEHILWQQLKLLKTEGRHVRRQVPIDKYIADFACHYPKVVVELDGGQHSDAAAYVEAGTAGLQGRGFHDLRFWNAEVFRALEGVVDHIRHSVKLKILYSYSMVKLHSTPTPALPARGGSKENPW